MKRLLYEHYNKLKEKIKGKSIIQQSFRHISKTESREAAADSKAGSFFPFPQDVGGNPWLVWISVQFKKESCLS